MKLTKQQVFETICSEREYQDSKWGGENIDESRSVGDWLIFMNVHLAKAMISVYDLDDVSAMDQIRKVTALGFAAMENKGSRKR